MMDEETLKYAIRCASVRAAQISNITGRPGDRDDFRQQILLRIVKNFHLFDPKKGSIKTFLNIVAHSESKNILFNLKTWKNRIIRDAIRIP